MRSMEQVRDILAYSSTIVKACKPRLPRITVARVRHPFSEADHHPSLTTVGNNRRSTLSHVLRQSHSKVTVAWAGLGNEHKAATQDRRQQNPTRYRHTIYASVCAYTSVLRM